MGMTNQEAVQILNEQRNKFMDEYVDFGGVNEAYSKAIDLLKRQEPKRPVHIHQEYEEHDWKRDEDGEIDRFAFEYDLCAGPYCERCGFSFCEYCWPDGWKQPCVIDKDVCPSCKERVWKPMKFCSDCGQELKWDEGD